VIPINEDLRRRAEALTRAWHGDWNDETHRGRNAGCPMCGICAVSVTPKSGKGILLICNDCHAGDRGDDRLITAARMAGIDCSPGYGRKSSSGGRIWPATSDSITGLKKAERRVLKFVAAQTSTGEWFEVSQREIKAACRVSTRDSVPFLERLAERGLLRIRSNNYAAKRRTQIAFLVDPIDLSKRLVESENETTTERLVDAVNSALENEVTPSENEVTMECALKMKSPPWENEVTVERPDVRIT
jgi:hypothetical protein